MIKFLDLNKQYLEIKDEIDEVISDVITKSCFIKGEYVERFEEDFSKYIGIDHCIGVGNGTDALEIAIESLDLPIGSEILVPANSFIATSEAITRTGHKVVFCDCKESDYTISVDDMKEKITKKTKAVIPVHLYGCPCDISYIKDVAKRYKLKIIEDCAQAHGAEFMANKVGTFGDIATFSFFPGKLLGAYGDGGAIVMGSSKLAERCRKIANHGRLKKYDHEMEGRNSRLDGIQAGILSVKLKHLDEWLAKRNEIANAYDMELRDSVEITQVNYRKRHAYHLYVIRHDDRDGLKEELSKKGSIPTGIHYPISLPMLKAYKYLKQTDTCKTANEFSKKVLSLPIHEYMIREDVSRIADIIKNYG